MGQVTSPRGGRGAGAGSAVLGSGEHPRCTRKWPEFWSRSATRSLWVVGSWKEPFPSLYGGLSDVSSLRESERQSRGILRYCLSGRGKILEKYSTPAVQSQNSFFQGGGPGCSVYTPGPGAKGEGRLGGGWLPGHLWNHSCSQAALYRQSFKEIPEAKCTLCHHLIMLDAFHITKEDGTALPRTGSPMLSHQLCTKSAFS